MPSVQLELEERIRYLNENPKAYQKMAELLKYMEDKQIFNPDIMFEYGSQLVNNYKSSLGTKLWRLYEQTFLAALQLRHIKEAADYWEEMQKKFPESKRVKCFRGMWLEAKAVVDRSKATHLLEDARKQYEDVLRDDPNNQTAHKRMVSLALGQGKTDNAIDRLNSYLTTYHNDFEAWKQLAKLHLKQHNYKLAMFALEELLLGGPDNYVYHTLYAETLFAMGGNANLKTARKHYAQSLNRNSDPNNMRALLGYILCCQQLGPSEAERLETLVVERIRAAYENSPNKHMLQYLEDLLSAVEEVG